MILDFKGLPGACSNLLFQTCIWKNNPISKWTALCSITRKRQPYTTLHGSPSHSLLCRVLSWPLLAWSVSEPMLLLGIRHSEAKSSHHYQAYPALKVLASGFFNLISCCSSPLSPEEAVSLRVAHVSLHRALNCQFSLRVVPHSTTSTKQTLSWPSHFY